MAAAEAEKRALIDELTKPSGLSEDEKIKRASTVIQRALRNGLLEVQVYRFPNILCTDRGRAINQMEPGWEKTLTGIPISSGGITCSRAATRSLIRSSIFRAGSRRYRNPAQMELKAHVDCVAKSVRPAHRTTGNCKSKRRW